MNDSRHDSVMIAFDYVRERIFNQTFKPGQRLIGNELAKSMGLSRTPVRQALAQLDLIGLVEQSGWGYRVRIMTLKDIDALFEVRSILEVAATRISMQFVDDESVAQMESLIKQSEDHLHAGRLIESIRVARSLYVLVAELTSNNVLSSMLARINDQIQFVGGNLVQKYPWRANEILVENKQFVTAYKQRDIEVAVRVLTQHIQRSREIVSSNKEYIYQI